MSTIDIIILVFYILGCIATVYVKATKWREHDDYLTLGECLYILLLSIMSWFFILNYIIVEYGNKPIIKFNHRKKNNITKDLCTNKDCLKTK